MKSQKCFIDREKDTVEGTDMSGLKKWLKTEYEPGF